MKISKEEAKDLLSALFSHGYPGKEPFLLPCLSGKNLYPYITEQELSEVINEIMPQFLYAQENDSSSNKFKSLKELIGELTFDGKGFFIPCFSIYVNKQPENQIPNASKVSESGKVAHFYDFSKDTAFEAFCLEVSNNSKVIEKWIAERKNQLGAHAKEYIADMNQEDKNEGVAKGLKEMWKPYIERIAKLRGQS